MATPSTHPAQVLSLTRTLALGSSSSAPEQLTTHPSHPPIGPASHLTPPPLPTPLPLPLLAPSMVTTLKRTSRRRRGAGFGFSTDNDGVVTGCGGAAEEAGVPLYSRIVQVRP